MPVPPASARISSLLLSILVLAAPASAQDNQDKMRVGVIEFRAENDVGFENSGRIVAEWVASEIVRVGRFEVSERLSLESILLEQDLGLTGVISDETAAQVGKIHGVSGIITGSLMKIGSTISVTGRIIAVETGEVLKTSVVRADNLDALPHEIEVLANALSEVSRAEFEIQQDITKRRSSYLAVGGGIAPGFSRPDSDLKDSGIGVAVYASLNTSRFSIWLNGVPLGGMLHLSFGGMYNISPFWGVVAEYGLITDQIIDEVSSFYYLLGIGVQPRHEISGKLMVIGGTTKGQIWVWDESEGVEGFEWVEGAFSLFPPASFGVELTYRLRGNNTVSARYIVASLSDYTLESHADPFGNYYEAGLLSIVWQREFAISF